MKTYQSNQSGSALVLCVSFILLASIISGAVLYAGMTHYRIADRQIRLEQALFMAESGIEIGCEYLSRRKGYIGNSYSDSGTVGGGSYAYTLTRTGWRTYSMSSTGTINGLSRSISLGRIYLPTYAEYALWMDRNGRIYFIPGEEFFGKVHSNDKLWFYGNSTDGGPTFWEKVSTALDEYGGSIEYVDFHDEFSMNDQEGQVGDIDFDSTDVGSLKTLANDFGMVLKGETTITFDGDDMLITNTDKGWVDHVVPIGEDQIVYVEDKTSGSDAAGNIIVDGGTVDGRLTLVSDRDIRINDHIYYQDDPTDDVDGGPQSDDALGLIAKDDVWVTLEAPDNLEINAAILAAGADGPYNNGSFGVLRYNRGDPRGSLNVNGSIVQDVRGAVGTFNSSGPVNGYYKNYLFDDRFKDKPPPYYPPVSDEVRYDDWQEHSA